MKRGATLLLVLSALGLAPGATRLATAQSRLWQRVTPSTTSAAGRDRLVAQADNELRLARQLVTVSTPDLAAPHVRKAIALYEKAMAGRPDADLHYRAVAAARLLEDDAPDKSALTIRHIEGVRAADPLDTHDMELTLDLCHALAKTAAQGRPGADAIFARTVAEYESWFSRFDEVDTNRQSLLANNYANLAEIYMAVGKLTLAIASYRRATDYQYAGNVPEHAALPWYGLAVAYDRDGQVVRAREAMTHALDLDPSMVALSGRGVYFVPDGDVHFYKGLGYEVAGDRKRAADAYREFLVVGRSVRPEYRERARRRLAEISVGSGGDAKTK